MIAKFIILEDRSVIEITGDDRKDFLQNLVSNDINLLSENNSIYSTLLTPQGKFLFDFFIYEYDNDKLLIDINKNFALDFIKKLSLYKLRSKVFIKDVSNDFFISVINRKICSVKSNLEGHTIKFAHGILVIDPRLQNMGCRIITPKDKRQELLDIAKEQNYQECDLKDYHIWRYNNLIPDGYYDLIQDKSYILEYRFDKINAISFDKGCFIGQEVTTRTYRRGVIRKSLKKIVIKNKNGDLLDANNITKTLEIQNKEKEIIGEIGSPIADDKGNIISLALVKNEFVSNAYDILETIYDPENCLALL